MRGERLAAKRGTTARRALTYLLLGLGIAGAPGGASAVGGNDVDTATKVDRTTQRCQQFISKRASKYASKAATAINNCLDSVLKCDEQADAAKALACRRKLLKPGTGKCAVGKVDEDQSLIGAGAAAAAAAFPSSKAILVKEMNRYVASLASTCFPGADLGDPDTGLGFSPLPGSAGALADAVNPDPGGLQCLVNATVLETYPLAEAIVDVVEVLHETCVDGPTLGAACTSNAQCGAGGLCGRLARVFREGSLGLEECTSAPPVVAVCGNGDAEVPEECDDGNLAPGDGCSATCTLEPAHQVVATGQTTCWDSAGTPIACAGTGQDGETQFGAPLAYLDNGDGTITDLRSGLMWEKLSDDGSIHDKDDTYSWTGAVSGKIAALNGASFAGYTDWRVPNAKELVSILDLGTTTPSVPPAFNSGCAPACTVLTCSCTGLDGYWSSDTVVDFPTFGYAARTDPGLLNFDLKGNALFVRAVRGGN